MASKKKINLCLYWHQHQPSYFDPDVNELIMPWVRLHSTKDYVDMALLVERFPKVHQTINLVPSLIDQIHGYVDKTLTDTSLRLSEKPAEELTENEKRYLLDHFFDANEQWMIRPYPRYRSLWRQRSLSIERCLTQFSAQDFRDLQVWFNLVWIDPVFRNDTDRPLAKLMKKREGFTEEEKQSVLAEHRRLMGEVVQTHRRLQEAGLLEVTTTPFFHPILPLLCDSDAARAALPDDPLPSPSFRAPEDAKVHVKRAIQQYEEEFGCQPKGMWPAEGSVSQEAVSLLVEQGIQWAATDEGVLFKSKLKEAKTSASPYRPYKVETPAGPITLVFRDHKLSDLIGFDYSRSPAERAADDFVARIHKIGKQHGSPCTVFVILDGENCWEYYPEDGLPFLEALYTRLSADSTIRCCTVSEALDKHPPKETIVDLFPASWIETNFRIWIAGSETNQAWDHLRQTRNALVHGQDKLSEEDRRKAWDQIYVAEGSDWFWWYCEYHPSRHALTLDRIFRNRLIEVYRILDQDPPSRLLRPIRSKGQATQAAGGRLFRRPNPLGKGFFEWAGASEYLAGKAGGAMHRTSFEIPRILYGVTDNSLALRIETTSRLAHSLSLGQSKIRLICVSPIEREIELDEDGKDLEVVFVQNTLIVMVNLERLLTSPENAVTTTTFEFALEVVENGEAREHCPEAGIFSVPLPGLHLHLQRWFV